MGRFGNVLLVGGEPELALTARRGEVVRFYLTNTANTRVFNLGLRCARMKLVGGDSGRCEQEAFVETVVLAPSERVVVDVLFDQPGQVLLEHHTPDRSYALGTVRVSEDPITPSLASSSRIAAAPTLSWQRAAGLAPTLAAAPDKTLAFVAEMDLEAQRRAPARSVYSCPMHADVISQEPGRCPKCGMALLPTTAPVQATPTPVRCIRRS